MYMAVLVFLCLLSLLCVLWPYFRHSETEEQLISPDVGVYKAQLEELENDIHRGLINAEESKQTRVEIERRLLKAANEQKVRIEAEKPDNIIVVSLVVTVMLSAGLYAMLGTPGMPDFPKRLEQNMAGDGEQADEIARNQEMIEKVTARLAIAPDEAQGWAVLGRLERDRGDYQVSAEALNRARNLEPDNFDYALMYAESLIAASGQRVTPAAKVILNNASNMNPDHPGPKFYLGLADYQAGEIETAVDEWKSARGTLSSGHPMGPLLDAWINKAEVDLGVAEPMPRSNAPSISREQAEAIQNMSDEEQQAFIAQMVEQLAEKQQQNPTNIQGWIQLSRSYMVLGRREEAIAAMQSAVDNAPEAQKEGLQKEVEKLTNMQ